MTRDVSNDTEFQFGSRRPVMPSFSDSVLQWSSGLQSTTRQPVDGFIIEVGQDSALDAACQHYPRVHIKHKKKQNVVSYWHLKAASLFVIALGFQSIVELGSTDERYGVAFAYGTVTDGGQPRRRSMLRVRVIVQELAEAGYTTPLKFTIYGKSTVDLLAAFNQQFNVIDALNTEVRIPSGNPKVDYPVYAISIPIGPTPVPVSRVSRTSQASAEVIAPMSFIPDIFHVLPTEQALAAMPPAERAARQEAIKAYIAARWCRKPWRTTIESQVEATARWSRTISTQFAAGEDRDHEASGSPRD